MKDIGRAGLNAGRVHARFQSVRAKVAFVGDVVFVAANGAVGAGVRTLALVIAKVWVNPHDAVALTNDGLGGTRFKARRILALHAQGWQEVTRNLGKFAVLPVVNLSAKTPQRHIIFNFAGNRTGMAADAAFDIDGKFPLG